MEWHHSGGSHTVTNGAGPADPNAGIQFDLPLTAAQPVATFTFDDPGDRFYFCRPHVGLGMTGRIRVVAVTGAPGCVDCDRSWAGIKTLYR